MLSVLLRYLLAITLLFSHCDVVANILITDIEKTENGEWTVSYRSHQPIKSIQFVSSPDSSRLDRWEFIEEGFEFRLFNQRETVVRRDNQPFTSVKFTLTPTYTSLPKYYAPFSPFSDGSMLFHSARFFACANLCSGYDNQFYLALTVPENDSIIVNGHTVTSKASWYDSNDGQKVFVGQFPKTLHSKYFALIDNGLPDDTIDTLNTKLPLFLEALEQHLFPLTVKPTLYASYSKTSDGSYGRQGGVLSNQIFMHWYGRVVNDNPYELLWFFAHEAVHIYQGYGDRLIDAKDAWIHEGYADFVAGQLLLAHFPASADYVHRRTLQAKQKCTVALSSNKLTELSSNGSYQALYQCGLLFYDELFNHFEEDRTIASFKYWKALGHYVAPGEHITQDIVFDVAEKMTSPQVIEKIKNIKNFD